MDAIPAKIDGWGNAVYLRNELVSLLVVPEAGRILEYEVNGTNLFFVNDAMKGVVYTFAEAAASGEWNNYGGARFDVAPQSSWKKTAWKKEWPPPPLLNSRREISLSDRSVRMSTAPDVEMMGIGVSADIRLVPGSTVVQVQQTISNVGKRSIEWSNWCVAQLLAESGRSRIYLPSADKSAFKDGYKVMMSPADGDKKPVFTSIGAGRASSFEYEGREWKFGFDSREWIALRPRSKEDLVFVMVSRIDRVARYPDDGCSVELYTSAQMPYVELEVLCPLAQTAQDGRRRDRYSWATACCPGEIVDVNDCGVISSSLSCRGGILKGRFGVFYNGTARVIAVDRSGNESVLGAFEVSPSRPFDVEMRVQSADGYAGFRIDLESAVAGQNTPTGGFKGTLAAADAEC